MSMNMKMNHDVMAIFMRGSDDACACWHAQAPKRACASKKRHLRAHNPGAEVSAKIGSHEISDACMQTASSVRSITWLARRLLQTAVRHRWARHLLSPPVAPRPQPAQI